MVFFCSVFSKTDETLYSFSDSTTSGLQKAQQKKLIVNFSSCLVYLVLVCVTSLTWHLPSWSKPFFVTQITSCKLSVILNGEEETVEDMVACYSLDYLVRFTNDSNSSPQTVWTSILRLILGWNQWRSQKFLNAGAQIRDTSWFGSVWFDLIRISVHIRKANKEKSKFIRDKFQL